MIKDDVLNVLKAVQTLKILSSAENNTSSSVCNHSKKNKLCGRRSCFKVSQTLITPNATTHSAYLADHSKFWVYGPATP